MRCSFELPTLSRLSLGALHLPRPEASQLLEALPRPLCANMKSRPEHLRAPGFPWQGKKRLSKVKWPFARPEPCSICTIATGPHLGELVIATKVAKSVQAAALVLRSQWSIILYLAIQDRGSHVGMLLECTPGAAHFAVPKHVAKGSVATCTDITRRSQS